MEKENKSRFNEEHSDDYEEEDELSDVDFEPNPVLEKNMDNLMKQLHEVMEIKEKKKLLKGKPDPIFVLLKKYQRVLDRTGPQEHKDYFMKIYKRYRLPILSGKNDVWLRKNQVKIIYGDTKIRILLSNIYNEACTQATKAEDALEGFPEEAYDDCDDFFRKDFIMLYLYRVFREFAPDNDYDKLSKTIKELEYVLSLDEDMLDDQSTNKASERYSSRNSSLNPQNPLESLGDIGKIANDVMSSISKSTQENASDPNKRNQPPDFSKIVGSLLENDSIKNAFQTMFSSAPQRSGNRNNPQPPPNFQDILSNVSSSLQSPELQNTLNQTFGNLSKSASGGYEKQQSYEKPASEGYERQQSYEKSASEGYERQQSYEKSASEGYEEPNSKSLKEETKSRFDEDVSFDNNSIEPPKLPKIGE